MPRASLKRAVSVKISDFSNRDQDLLRAAFHAFVPMALIGFRDQDTGPFVIALGHPDDWRKRETARRVRGSTR